MEQMGHRPPVPENDHRRIGVISCGLGVRGGHCAAVPEADREGQASEPAVGHLRQDPPRHRRGLAARPTASDGPQPLDRRPSPVRGHGRSLRVGVRGSPVARAFG